MNLLTVALDLRPARRLRMSLVLVFLLKFVAWSMLPSRPLFAFPNAHLNRRLLRKKHSDGLKKYGLPGFTICHQRGADNGNLDVQGHGRLPNHWHANGLMKREAGKPVELMEADGRVADGRVAPTPFNRCQENSLCERHLDQLQECVFFAGGFIAIQHSEQGNPSSKWGLYEYVIVHTILGGSPVILWISLGGKPKMASFEIWIP